MAKAKARVRVRRWVPRRLRTTPPDDRNDHNGHRSRRVIAVITQWGDVAGRFAVRYTSLVLPLFMTGITLLVMAEMYTMAAVVGAVTFGLLLAASQKLTE